MAKIKKFDGRTKDLKFSWLLSTHGKQWLQWQEFAGKWMIGQHKATSNKRESLAHFFETYLLKYAPYAVNIEDFFHGKNDHRSTTEEFLEALKATGAKDPASNSRYINCSCDFIDWLIEHHFSFKDNYGVLCPSVTNPLIKIKRPSYPTETVRNPLPYRYIQYLRLAICPLPNSVELKQVEHNLGVGESLLPPYHYRHFRDWTWAQHLTGFGRTNTGDWFEVDPSQIDKSDPGCVWRTQIITRNSNKIKIHLIWSPVKAMMVFVKLHLPLRTYQIRFLDSGEADTWRYANGVWGKNISHDFAMGTAKRPFAKGTFKRILDSMAGLYSTGLYISTNKTADQNKEEIDFGYTIPWQHEELLYWLEKLRNWQEKYNPILEPISCSTLDVKHFGRVKSKEAMEQMGDYCFLFRDASAKGDDRAKPISNGAIRSIWYQLLLVLQNQLVDQGNKLNDGSTLKFVEDYPENTEKDRMRATFFPPHSLRVSLITAYIMDSELPLPVISKLLAGHTRLISTIYYNKITPSVMAEKMNEAHQALRDKSDQSIRSFLINANQEQIQCKMAYNDEKSIMATLANRNPIGWEQRAYGLCLVGGNTGSFNEVSTLGGCWNGGELIKGGKDASSRRHAAVSHGPENCVRCRWFITDASYLPVLNSHFNQLSYKAHLAANLSVEIEEELDALKDEQFFAEDKGAPFTKKDELNSLQHRYEKQQVEADEFTKDWIATFNLIQRIIHIENHCDKDNGDNKLVAVGNKCEISHSLKFTETDSELLQLSLLCEDAEIFPNLYDDLRKTPAIGKRTLQLSRIMMRKGYEPIFLEMDDRMQLIAANAMMRKMGMLADPNNKLEGFRKVVGYLEAEEYLRDHQLFDAGLDELKDANLISRPVKLKSYKIMECS